MRGVLCVGYEVICVEGQVGRPPFPAIRSEDPMLDVDAVEGCQLEVAWGNRHSAVAEQYNFGMPSGAAVVVAHQGHSEAGSPGACWDSAVECQGALAVAADAEEWHLLGNRRR